MGGVFSKWYPIKPPLPLLPPLPLPLLLGAGAGAAAAVGLPPCVWLKGMFDNTSSGGGGAVILISGGCAAARQGKEAPSLTSSRCARQLAQLTCS